MSSVLKNETIIETPEDVSGVLGMCSVLVVDQKDPAVSAIRNGSTRGEYGAGGGNGGRRNLNQVYDVEDMAEEQGWVARMVHLFQSDDLDVQFQVSFPCRCLAYFRNPDPIGLGFLAVPNGA